MPVDIEHGGVTLATGGFVQAAAPVGAPRMTVSVVPATDLTWGASGDVPLVDSFGRTWQDTLNDTGTGALLLENDDPALASVNYDKALVFRLDGQPVFTSLVESLTTDTIASGEEAAQTTKVWGRGALAILDDIAVYPEGGANHLPVGDRRLFFFGMASYFAPTGWENATVQALYSATTPNWNTGSPPVKAPRDFPDPTAGYIWNSLGNVNDAPQGTVYFRRTFTLAAANKMKFYASGDNLWTLWLDGTEIMADGQDGTSWIDTQHSDTFDMSAGDHILAARVTNTAPFMDPLPHPNPAFLLLAGYSVSPTDGTETLVLHTDATWKVSNYLPNAPPITAGMIMNTLLAEGAARGCFVPNVTFSDTNDSDGAPWSSRGTAGGPIYEFTVAIGDSVLGVLRSLADTYVDVRLRPGGFLIDMWDKGGHLVLAPTTLTSAYADPVNGNLTSLRHVGAGLQRNVLLVKYLGGYWERPRGQHTARRREGSVSLAVGTLGEARQVADTLIVLMREPQESIVATFESAGTTDRPYVDFLVGDLLTVPERDGTAAQARVIAMTVTEDAEGNPIFVPELDLGHSDDP